MRKAATAWYTRPVGDMIGKKLSHYEIQEKLGEGGMGVVYKAHDSRLDRAVAIKFLSSRIAEDEAQMVRFRSEARTAARLSHVGIATVHSFEEIDGHSFIVMEYVDGTDLAKSITDGPMDIERVRDVGRQIAEALATAHDDGVVHRDIKSANILIDGTGRAKITDFGLARTSGSTRLTRDGTTVGTMAYMSPELIQGGEANTATDLWALGVVLYEMLAGRLPFRSDYEASLLYEILNETPAALDSLRADAPKDMVQLVAELLQKNADRRPADAAEVAKRLATAVAAPVAPDVGHSIAVLYFENMSSDKENEYFCAGITEDLIIDLSRLSDLRVIPRQDVLSFRHKEINRQAIGRQLGVTHVLEGSVRRAGDKIRITAQLIDVESGFQVWGERYDRLLEDIFEVQADVSQQITEAMKLSLTDSEKEELGKERNVDLRAYDLYMRGRELFTKSGGRNVRAAVQMFEAAIEIDSSFALAYAALGEAATYMSFFFSGDTEWADRALVAGKRALELDPELGEARYVLGLAYLQQKRFDDAMATFKDVIDKNPNFYGAYRWASITAQGMGDFGAAVEYAEGAVRVAPYSEEGYLHLVSAAQKNGDTELANRAREAEVANAMRKLELDPDNHLVRSRLAPLYVHRGDEREARRLLELLEQSGTDEGVVLYNMSCTWALLNDRENSLDYLRKALKAGYSNIIEWVQADPDYDFLRDDPEFKEIVGLS